MAVKFNPFTGNLDLIDTTAAAGSTTQVQYNNAGLLAGSADLTWDDSGKELGIGGDISLDDGGTYTTTLQTVTATANRTISFPDATGTVGLVAGSSGQVTYNDAGAQAGGNLGYDKTAGTFGYSAGRGTITQGTNKSTGVTLNAPCGAVTMHNEALNADTTVSFTLTNSSITANDILLLNHISGGTAGAYVLNAQAAAGSASVNVRNITAGSLSEAIVIGFAIIKS
jgi:YD repeat-containing protein